jgi:hypothetical protein
MKNIYSNTTLDFYFLFLKGLGGKKSVRSCGIIRFSANIYIALKCERKKVDLQNMGRLVVTAVSVCYHFLFIYS